MSIDGQLQNVFHYDLLISLSKVKLGFMFMKHYAHNRCEPSIEVIMKMGSNGGPFFVLFLCVCFCVVFFCFLFCLFFFVLFFLFCFFIFFWGGGGGQGGCERERRIEVIVKIKKKNRGRGQVRVDVNEELKFL